MSVYFWSIYGSEKYWNNLQKWREEEIVYCMFYIFVHVISILSCIIIIISILWHIIVIVVILCTHIKISKMVVYKQCLIDGCDGVFLYDDGGNGSDGKSTPW